MKTEQRISYSKAVTLAPAAAYPRLLLLYNALLFPLEEAFYRVTFPTGKYRLTALQYSITADPSAALADFAQFQFCLVPSTVTSLDQKNNYCLADFGRMPSTNALVTTDFLDLSAHPLSFTGVDTVIGLFGAVGPAGASGSFYVALTAYYEQVF